MTAFVQNAIDAIALGSLFADFRVLVYESHSTDATRAPSRCAAAACGRCFGQVVKGK